MAPGRVADRLGRTRRRHGVAGRSHRRGETQLSNLLEVAAEVAGALEAGRPVVALETSIVGQGLPAPHNLRAARGCEAAIREEGAVPATIAVLDGRLRAGLTEHELARIAEGSVKVSSRDLGPALAGRTAGATTVAATMRIATEAGIHFLATGGIGGVHRGHPEDQSADLEELARSKVAVFCAGAKIILDLALTLERLESLSVPVIGYACDEFPAFYSARSGFSLNARVEDPAEAAAVLKAAWETGSRGVVMAVPPPRDLPEAESMAALAARELGSTVGANVTPRLLARMAELSSGRSVELNVELVINNARIAAQVARAFAAIRP